MLGRILHAKRVQPPSKYIPPMSQRRKKLLPVLPKPAETVEPIERTELEHDVNDIIRMSSMEGDKVKINKLTFSDPSNISCFSDCWLSSRK